MNESRHTAMTSKLVSTLYAEAMDLAESARDYFDKVGQWDRQQLDPMGRVVFSCESLRVTTRLMHTIAWLMTQKAVFAGEMTIREAMREDHRLGGRESETSASPPDRIAALPVYARELIDRSEELFERVRRLDQQMEQSGGEALPSPAKALLDRLESSF